MRMKKRILWIAVDILIAAVIVFAVWITGYKLPQGGIRAAAFAQEEVRAAAFAQTINEMGTGQEITPDERKKETKTETKGTSYPHAEEGGEAEEQEIPKTQSDSLQRTCVIISIIWAGKTSQ